MMMDKTYEVYYFSPDNPTHLEQWLEGILRTTGLRLLAVTGDYWIFEQTNLFDTSAKVGSLASDAMESYAEFYDKAVVALGFSSGALPSQQMDDMMLERIAELTRRDEIIARLKEDAERLASTYVIEVFPHEWVCRGGCHHWARFGEQIEHSPDCPITLHRALMKELE